jgi:hypothetical protein
MTPQPQPEFKFVPDDDQVMWDENKPPRSPEEDEEIKSEEAKSSDSFHSFN